MNAPLRQRMTLEQFLAWEARQPERWEFDSFAPVAMADGTAAHSAIQRNLAIGVGGWLLGLPEIGVELPLAELYVGVEVDEPTTEPA